MSMDIDMNVEANTKRNVDLNTIDLTVPSPSDAKSSENQVQRKYKITLAVWEDFEKVVVNGKLEFGKCKWCKKKLKCLSAMGTSTLSRHLKRCLYNKGKNKDKKQLVLSFSTPSDGSTIVTPWKFDQELCRKALVRMIIIDELPFKFVEKEGFKDFCQVLQPLFELFSRTTLVKDCFQLYKAEKDKLINMFKTEVQTICLTTNLWTSIQNVGYLCLTAHYIDTNWKLQKRILNFCILPSPHTGDAIAHCIEACLDEWKIKKVCTISVDNASSNDVVVRSLKYKLDLKGRLLGDGENFHVSCAAHIINLIVRDGISEINASINRIRNAVKYVRSSVGRQEHFQRVVESCNLSFKGTLYLDVATRWNSTFLMLQTALKFKNIFQLYASEDKEFLYQEPPNTVDWEQARVICRFLEHFYESTKVLCGFEYVTANQYFLELYKIQMVLMQMSNDDDPLIREMCKKMRDKFNKYWGSIGKVNMLLALAVVLDPRFKLAAIRFCYTKILDREEANQITNMVKHTLVSLFRMYQQPLGMSSSEESSVIRVTPQSNAFFDEFKLWKQSEENVDEWKNEVDRYLEEASEENEPSFDVLGWWKNCSKYRTLSYLARDVLAIPVSTVASESAFSTGGRVLDQYRSSLTPKLVECLICAQDWLRATPRITEDEEKATEFERLISGIINSSSNKSPLPPLPKHA